MNNPNLEEMWKEFDVEMVKYKLNKYAPRETLITLADCAITPLLIAHREVVMQRQITQLQAAMHAYREKVKKHVK